MKGPFRIVLLVTGMSMLSTSLRAAPKGEGQTATVCKNGELERRVEVSFTSPGQEVPCEVHYFKPKENASFDQTIYRADKEAGFCARKHDEFVEKLRGMGWDCAAENKTQVSQVEVQ